MKLLRNEILTDEIPAGMQGRTGIAFLSFIWYNRSSKLCTRIGDETEVLI